MFLLITNILFALSNAETLEVCPSNCTCITPNKVDCLGLELEKIPDQLPAGLTYLNMAKNGLTDFTDELLSDFSSTIKEIYLQKNRIQRVQFNSRLEFPNLTDIDFRNNGIFYF